MNWHLISKQELFSLLDTSSDGLSHSKAKERYSKHGPNEISREKKDSLLVKFLMQFRDFMIIVLLAAAVISGVMGDLKDTIIILLIVVINAVISFIQEYRAEKAVEALRSMAAQNATVVREGKINTVAAKDLVPGDVVILEAGQIVPADIRLTEVNSLMTQEASLTGESESEEKQAVDLSGGEIPLGDRKNMAFKGTFISKGRGTGVVVQTGMNTEMGKIAKLLSGSDTITPLQRRMAAFGKRLALVVLFICAIVFIVGYLRGEEVMRLLLTTISLAVAAIPEALPAVITVVLAIGAKKMVKRNALIRKLPAVETLGSVTYICTDKTGTLTQNKMRVENIFVPEDYPGTDGKDIFMLNMALSNDVQYNEKNEIIGDSTEVALFDFAASRNYNKHQIEKIYPRVGEAPFDSERKRMSTLHQYGDRFLLLVKGALESLVDISPEAENSKTHLLQKETEKMAASGYRVIAHGFRILDKVPENTNVIDLEQDLTIMGLSGIMDPPRQEANEAISDCYSAGIRPVMITGDHPETARSIATKIGILRDSDQNNPDSLITGKELSRLGWQDFLNRVLNIRVYARVSPEQKLNIVKALQDKGQFVAMTGDGVNDAPALKTADIGVAMGITGTDVSKEAAHMVLLDDNFASIASAVREGRRIFDNIRKFIKYTLTSNSGEVWAIFLAPLIGLPIPLLPVHILWINLVTDGLPGLALSSEIEEKDIMKKPPRHPRENIFSGGLGRHVLWVGFLMGAVTIGVQAWAIHIGDPRWQTMAFNVLCLSQMGHVLSIRSDTRSLFRIGLLSNKPLIGAVLLTFALQMAVTYVPFLQSVFNTEALTFLELVIVIAVSSIVFIAVELEKMFHRARKKHGPNAPKL